MFGYDYDSRLVLADWLEEQGDIRATLVRLRAHLDRVQGTGRRVEIAAQRAYYAELFAVGGWLPSALQDSVEAILGSYRLGFSALRADQRELATIILITMDRDHGVHPDTPAIRRLVARFDGDLLAGGHTSEYVIRVRCAAVPSGWLVDQGSGNSHVYPGRHPTMTDAIIHGLARRAVQRSFHGYQLDII